MLRTIRVSVLIATTSWFTACVSQPTSIPTLWKTGATPLERLSDDNACSLQALSAAPRSLSTTATPVFTTPSNVQCTTYGSITNCQQYGGQTLGGNQSIVDLNAELRERVYQQCMAEKGYASTNLPVCSSDQRQFPIILKTSAVTPSASNVLCVTNEGYVQR